MKELFFHAGDSDENVPDGEHWGNVHPEIQREKYKYKNKDFFIFNHYGISRFLRLLYEGEEKTLNEEAIRQSCLGEPCVAVVVMWMVDEERGIKEKDRGRCTYYLNQKDFEVQLTSGELPYWSEEDQGLFVPKPFKKTPRGFKNK